MKPYVTTHVWFRVRHIALRAIPSLLAVASSVSAGRWGIVWNTSVTSSRKLRICMRAAFQGFLQRICAIPYISYSAEKVGNDRSEEHTSELQSLMRISYAVFCLKKKKH